MDNQVVVIKLSPARQEIWRYTGTILKREPHVVQLEALFNREDMLFHGIVLGKGDRFVEIFYDDRWYNIFEIHDREDGRLKGWYCNICLPAEFMEGEVRYVDLALDLLVYPDGNQLVLDEDEFEMMQLEAEIQTQARSALRDLQTLFSRLKGVFL